MSITVQERSSETVIVEVEPPPAVQRIVLRAREESSEPRVRWAEDTIDNEFMGKKKSKCCCIYKKPRKWDEDSDSEDSDCETGHCRGHVEKKKPQSEDGSKPGPSKAD